MINILKPGKRGETKKTKNKLTCRACGCEFTCEDEDFKSHEKCLDGYSTIECPDCGHEMRIQRSDPNNWYKEDEE